MNNDGGDIRVWITSTSHPLRILLIEDSKGDAILVEKALSQAMPEAHSIKTATTLEGALKILAEHEFDVALLDRSLPDTEEFSGLHSIQGMFPELPVVFLTAYQDELTAFEAIIQGAQDYLLKSKLNGHVIKRTIQYAILRKQFEGVLIMRANFDMLTGLANRMLFESRLELALAKMKRQAGNLAVLYLDLDRFKQVNDTLGHAVGDKLLKEAGKRLKQSLRPYDTTARFGGDEFAVLLEGIAEVGHCEIVAQKIIQLFDAPFQISGKEIEVGISIGIATCTAGQTMSGETLMHQADEAMYAAKSNSASAYELYSTDYEKQLNTAKK